MIEIELLNFRHRPKQPCARPFGKGVALGKPYRDELDLLSETFDWVCQQKLESITRAVTSSSYRPILAIGSGGSIAAAEYLAALHTRLSSHLSTGQTPLEFLRSEARITDFSVWLLSAGGRNLDILRSVRRAIHVEPAHVAVLCASVGSPLATLAKPFAIDVLEYEPPAGKDGFLATNSLASFLLLIARTYANLIGASFPDSLPRLMEQASPDFCDSSSLRERFAPLLDREHWLILYDPGCRAFALDMESRFSEAALGSVIPSDLRNFAHGRHNWIAKRASTSAVIIVSQPGTAHLATRSLALLPRSLPCIHLRFSDDPILAPVGAILISMEIAGWAGEARGIDPGRPGVPEFGRRLYNLPTSPVPKSTLLCTSHFVARKARLTTTSLRASELERVWEMALQEFRKDLYQKPVRAIVFDYDGTLVKVEDRFDPPRNDISSALVKLLAAGIRLGIATGRGRSVRRDVREVIPREYWADILIGYHNGAELGRLDDDTTPDSTQHTLDPTIAQALTILEDQPIIRRHLTIDPSHSQLALQWKSPILGWQFRSLLEPVLPALQDLGLRMVTSGHSVDLLAPGVTKRRVITRLAEDDGLSVGEILAIGDRGRPPGNDAEMLAHRPSLSVDEASDQPSTCWRLTPPMVKGPTATLWYLSRLTTRQRFQRAVFFKKGSLEG